MDILPILKYTFHMDLLSVSPWEEFGWGCCDASSKLGGSPLQHSQTTSLDTACLPAPSHMHRQAQMPHAHAHKHSTCVFSVGRWREIRGYVTNLPRSPLQPWWPHSLWYFPHNNCVVYSANPRNVHMKQIAQHMTALCSVLSAYGNDPGNISVM